MKGYDLFELAVRNLRQSKLRNGLTTIGISVGVASLVAMLSLGVGLQQLATKRLAGSGMFDTVFVTSKQDSRGFDRDEDKKDQHPEKSPVLDEAARAQMTHLQYVTEVVPEVRVMGQIGGGVMRNTIHLKTNTAGMDTDIVAQGPLLVGGGVGYLKKLGARLAFVADLSALVGVAITDKIGTTRVNTGFGADLSIGFAVGF